MFGRFYFLIQAALIFSPLHSLHSKRICVENSIEPSMSFQLRACMTRHPLESLLVLFITSITFFSQIFRITERPYYKFNLDPPQFDFHDLGSSIYFTITTLTSVGYGDTVASTQLGRFMTAILSLYGAFLMSLVVAIIASLFFLTEKQKSTIALVTE